MGRLSAGRALRVLAFPNSDPRREWFPPDPPVGNMYLKKWCLSRLFRESVGRWTSQAGIVATYVLSRVKVHDADDDSLLSFAQPLSLPPRMAPRASHGIPSSALGGQREPTRSVNEKKKRTARHLLVWLVTKAHPGIAASGRGRERGRGGIARLPPPSCRGHWTRGCEAR